MAKSSSCAAWSREAVRTASAYTWHGWRECLRASWERADEVLHQLEQSMDHEGLGKGIAAHSEAASGMQMSIFQLDDPVLCQIRDEILNTDINNLTPIEALNRLNDIKKLVGGK